MLSELTKFAAPKNSLKQIEYLSLRWSLFFLKEINLFSLDKKKDEKNTTKNDFHHFNMEFNKFH